MSKETVLAAMVFFPFVAGLLAYAVGRFCRRTGAGRGREAGQKTGGEEAREAGQETERKEQEAATGNGTAEKARSRTGSGAEKAGKPGRKRDRKICGTGL